MPQKNSKNRPGLGVVGERDGALPDMQHVASRDAPVLSPPAPKECVEVAGIVKGSEDASQSVCSLPPLCRQSRPGPRSTSWVRKRAVALYLGACAPPPPSPAPLRTRSKGRPARPTNALPAMNVSDCLAASRVREGWHVSGQLGFAGGSGRRTDQPSGGLGGGGRGEGRQRQAGETESLRRPAPGCIRLRWVGRRTEGACEGHSRALSVPALDRIPWRSSQDCYRQDSTLQAARIAKASRPCTIVHVRGSE